MPIPVIDPKISLPVFRVGEFFSFKPAASNAPTSWAIDAGDDDLPSLGLAFNTTTGLLSGAFKKEGFYNFAISAINGAGTSAPLFLPLGIWPALNNLDPTVELDLDLQTGAVTRRGALGTDPALFGKHGDKMVLDIGFTKSGALLDIPLQTLKFGVVELMEEPLLITLNDGVPFPIGDYAARRFRIVADLNNDKIKAALSGYQSDTTEFFDAVAEIEFIALVPTVDAESATAILRSSQNFTLRLAADIVPN